MKIIMHLSFAVFMAAVVGFYAESYPTCPSIKPLPPIDCVNPVGLCSCGAYGCRWVWLCDNNP